MFWTDEVTLAEAARLLDVSEAEVMRLIQKQLLSARWQIGERGQRIRLIKRDLVLGLKDSGRHRLVLGAGPTASTTSMASAPPEEETSTAGAIGGATGGEGGATAESEATVLPADNTMALQQLMENTVMLRELIVALAERDEHQSREFTQQVARLEERMNAAQESRQQHTDTILGQILADREATRKVFQTVQDQIGALGTATTALAQVSADSGAKLESLSGTLDQLTTEIGRLFEAVDATQQYLRDHFEGSSLAKLGKLGKAVIERKAK